MLPMQTQQLQSPLDYAYTPDSQTVDILKRPKRAFFSASKKPMSMVSGQVSSWRTWFTWITVPLWWSSFLLRLGPSS